MRFDSPHFGVIVNSGAPAGIAVYGDEGLRDEGLRASFYPRAADKGYPIEVRNLS